MDADTLQKIREKLPKRYIKILKDKTNVSESTIYKTLRGDLNNETVIKAALELIEENLQFNNDIKERVNKLCQ